METHLSLHLYHSLVYLSNQNSPECLRFIWIFNELHDAAGWDRNVIKDDSGCCSRSLKQPTASEITMDASHQSHMIRFNHSNLIINIVKTCRISQYQFFFKLSNHVLLYLFHKSDRYFQKFKLDWYWHVSILLSFDCAGWVGNLCCADITRQNAHKKVKTCYYSSTNLWITNKPPEMWGSAVTTTSIIWIWCIFAQLFYIHAHIIRSYRKFNLFLTLKSDWTTWTASYCYVSSKRLACSTCCCIWFCVCLLEQYCCFCVMMM